MLKDKMARSEVGVTVCWFRRDLRLEDNHALWQALRSGRPVLPIFIFDSVILDLLSEKEDRRVAFIFSTIQTINRRLQEQYQSGIRCLKGRPEELFEKLLTEYRIEMVCCNEEYEPYAIARDRKVEQLLARRGIPFGRFKDQVIFHKDEILTAAGNPYTVYTPYSRTWLARYRQGEQRFYPSEELLNNLLKG